jgi:diaminopimelate epimerase
MEITKYSASGNDFVVFDATEVRDRVALARKLCDRHEGVGADGLIVIVPTDEQECDFAWQFFNSDGSTPSMCGNGSRACAHYAYTHGLAPAKMRFLTGAGVISASVDGDEVEVQLTAPRSLGEPFDEMGFTWRAYDTGVPHLVTLVDDLARFDLECARKIRYNHNSNVNFLCVQDGVLHVRTYERGVEDETLACGTGMAACFCAARDLGLVEKSVRVLPKSGETLYLRMDGDNIFFKGTVRCKFKAILAKELNEDSV